MPPKKAAAKASKGAISKVVKQQGVIAKKAAAGKAKPAPAKGKAAAPAPKGGSRAGTRSGGATKAASASPAKKAPAKKSGKEPAKTAVPAAASSVVVAAGQAPNLVANTNIYSEGATVWACDLAFVERAQNSDKFYNLRILVDSAGTTFWW